MKLHDILAGRAVRQISKGTSKKRLLCDMGHVAADCYGVEVDAAIQALMDREALGPTGVGDGVALPHARLPGLDRVHGVFFRLDAPINYDAVDRKPVDLVFGLFAPEGAGVTHLKALALVSRTMRERGLQAKLRANTDPQILHTLLTEAGPASEAA